MTITDCSEALAAEAAEAGEVKQASFMGLPPELRLRIYGYLFASNQDGCKNPHNATTKDSTATQVSTASEHEHSGESSVAELDETHEGDETEADWRTIHCCSVPNKDDGSYLDSSPLVCPCYGRLYPQILSTNKLISNEATPVFYGSVEIRLRLPYLKTSSSPGPKPSFALLLESVPTSSLPFITHILLMQTARDIGIMINSGDDPHEMDSLSAFWAKMANTIPNVKNVRLHIDMNADIHLNEFAFDEFCELVDMPKLRSVHVERAEKCLCCDDADNSEATIAAFAKTIAAIIKSKAESVGKRLEVTAA